MRWIIEGTFRNENVTGLGTITTPAGYIFTGMFDETPYTGEFLLEAEVGVKILGEFDQLNPVKDEIYKITNQHGILVYEGRLSENFWPLDMLVIGQCSNTTYSELSRMTQNNYFDPVKISGRISSKTVYDEYIEYIVDAGIGDYIIVDAIPSSSYSEDDIVTVYALYVDAFAHENGEIPIIKWAVMGKIQPNGPGY